MFQSVENFRKKEAVNFNNIFLLFFQKNFVLSLKDSFTAIQKVGI